MKKIGLRIEPISGKQDTTDFELLELRGEIAIYIDPANGLPVRFSGSRALYRNIGIQLTEASLAD